MDDTSVKVEAEDTVLEGCEIICIGEQNTDLFACPLSRDEQLKCKYRRQYQAGIKEVVKWINKHSRNTYIRAYGERTFGEIEWQAKLKEWGAE